jgi:hypothetical protein
MKVPTYKQETARTRETGSRNFSAQVSGRALAAPFEAQAEVFGQLANQSLDFMSAQLKRERDSEETKESLAILEERQKVKQIINQTPVGEIFSTENITGPGRTIVFNSESAAENFYRRSMDEFRKSRGFQFATEKREQTFNTALQRDDIFETSDIVNKARVRVVQNALAVHEQEVAALTNQLRTTASDMSDIDAVSFDSPGFDNEINFFSLTDSRIQAIFSRIDKSIDQAVANELYTEVEGQKLKNNIRSNTSYDIIKEKIEFSNNPQFLEELSRQIENLSPVEISADNRVALSNLNQQQISQILSAEDAEERARILEENRVSKELAEQIEFQIRTQPGSVDELRRKLINGQYQGLGLDKVNQLLSLIEGRKNQVSESEKAYKQSLISRYSSSEEIVKNGSNLDVPRAEELVRSLREVGEAERANGLELLVEVGKLTSSVDGESIGTISSKINDVENTPPSEMFPGLSEEQAEAFKLIAVNSLKNKRSKASAFFQEGFPLDYFAQTNEVPELNYTNRESINERLNLMDDVTRKFTEGSNQSFDQVKKQMQPLRESEVQGIADLLDGDELTPRAKASLLITLQPLLSEYPSTISKLAKSKKADVYVLASQLPIDVTTDIVSGLNQPSVLNEVTRQKLADDVTDKLGQTFLYIRDGRRTQAVVEKAIVAHVRANAPANFEDADLPELIDNAIDLIAPIGERGDKTFELPRPLNVNGDDDSFGRMFDVAGNEITDLDQKRDLMEKWFENFSVDMIKAFADEGLSDGFETPEKLEVVAKQIRDGKLLPISINNNKYAFVEGGSNQERLSKKNGKTFFVSWNPTIERILYSILAEKQAGRGRGNIASQAEDGENR